MKFNNVSIAAGVIVDFWEHRPGHPGGSRAGEAPSDGDYFQVSGSAMYRYSSTIGEWVRPFVYDGTPVLDIRLRGSILPQNESPPWILSASYQGGDVGRTDNVSTDGEYVTISHAGSNNEQNIHYSHGQYGKNHFFQGICQINGDSGGGRPDFLIKDGIKCAYINLEFNSKRLNLDEATAWFNITSYDARLYANAFTVTAFAPSHGTVVVPPYLEVYLASSGSTKGLMIFVNHEIHPSIVAPYYTLVDHNPAGTWTKPGVTATNDTILLDILTNSSHGPGFPVASGSIYFLGCTESTSGSPSRYKECFWGRY